MRIIHNQRTVNMGVEQKSYEKQRNEGTKKYERSQLRYVHLLHYEMQRGIDRSTRTEKIGQNREKVSKI